MVEWKERHIDLGREASIIHTILSAQLHSPSITDALRHSVHPLPAILEAVTKAGREDEDPLTSTFEALRAISQFNPNSGGENSGSSSEYTTPAQSQTTSPSHEQSPPPPGVAMQVACATVGSAAKVLSMQNNGGGETSTSPTTSPTHHERVSSLATHAHHAQSLSVGGKFNTYSSPGGRSRGSSGGSPSQEISLDVPHSPRRKSDSEIQRQRVRPSSQQLPGSTATILTSVSSGSSWSGSSSASDSNKHSRSIDHAIK